VPSSNGRDARDEYDVIVVGSGPGGATVARELAKCGRRVLILERGSGAPLKETILSTASIVNVLPVGPGLATARAFTTGGTTSIYFAVADSPPLAVYKSLGVDLDEALAEVKGDVPLSELPDQLVGARALRLRESAAELGYDWRKNSMLVDLSQCASGYTYAAKWKARAFVEEAVAHGAVVVNGARVLKVLVEGGKAYGVEYRMLGRGRNAAEAQRVTAATVILCAGGASSPVILRESGMRGVVNRGFYCNPNFGVVGAVTGLRLGGNFGASMGTVVDGDIGIGDGNFASAVYRMVMLNRRRFVRAFLPSFHMVIGVMVKERLGGGLGENGRYHKELTSEDRAKLAKGEDVARRILRRAGARGLFKLPVTAGGVAGTLRIGGLVDRHLQTEYENLYVCDASVIPDDANTNPTLTLLCLGKYLAKHLMGTSGGRQAAVGASPAQGDGH
jgi:choline dehydrogenase-like flavoprotein